MVDFDINLDLADSGNSSSSGKSKAMSDSRLRSCEYDCQHCGGDVVYFDENNWRHFTCMGCKSMSPLSPAALILATKSKPSRVYSKLRRQGVIKRGGRTNQ